MGSNIKRIVMLMIVLMFVAVAGIVLYANIRSEEKAVQTAQMDTETGAGEGETLQIGDNTRAFLGDETFFDPDKLLSGELEDLGIKHAAYNIPVSRILGKSTSEEYPTIEYAYQGKGYEFNGEVISEYDLIFRTLTEKDVEISVIILNDLTSSYPQMIHPLARSGIGTAPYYAFNGADEEGVEYMGAIASLSQISAFTKI